MKAQREDLVVKKLDELANMVDKMRVSDLPQIKMDVANAVSDVKLHVEKALNNVNIDIGVIKAKAGLIGAGSGIVASGIASALFAWLFGLFGHKVP